MKLGELLNLLTRAMVDQSDAVQVVEVSGLQATILEVSVAKEDVGKIIGKRGRNAAALRIILSAAATKLRKRAYVEILEPDG